MTDSEFEHMTLVELKEMMRQVIASGPNPEDKDFIKRLANEIAQREKGIR
jgi:hypothetical protein